MNNSFFVRIIFQRAVHKLQCHRKFGVILSCWISIIFIVLLQQYFERTTEFFTVIINLVSTKRNSSITPYITNKIFEYEGESSDAKKDRMKNRTSRPEVFVSGGR